MKQCQFCGKDLVEEESPIPWHEKVKLFLCKNHKNLVFISFIDNKYISEVISIYGKIYFADFVADTGKNFIFKSNDNFVSYSYITTLPTLINPDKDIDELIKTILVFS